MTPTVTQDQMFAALGDFLTTILPAGIEVIQGQANRVPSPSVPDYVVMTEMGRSRLATNYESYDYADDVGEISHERSTEIVVQIDVHGPTGADNADTIGTLWRSPYACDLISVFKPLYAVDAKQVPFVTGEMQYEDRWIVELHLQANPAIVTPAQFANIVDPTLVPVKV